MVFTGFLFLTMSACSQIYTPAAHGISLSEMDSSVRPGDNVYLYCNGAWVARTDIPADRTAITTFPQIAEWTDKQVTAILNTVVQSHPPAGTDARRITASWRSLATRVGLR